MWLAPSEIYYSQDSISNRFGKSTEHAGVLIGETLDDILSGNCSIDDIGTIEVVYRYGDYISADNRRLWIFKKLEELGECTEIPVTIADGISPLKCAVGLDIEVRGDPGGHLWRTWIESASSSSEEETYPSDSDDSDEEDTLQRGFARMSLSSYRY